MENPIKIRYGVDEFIAEDISSGKLLSLIYKQTLLFGDVDPYSSNHQIHIKTLESLPEGKVTSEAYAIMERIGYSIKLSEDQVWDLTKKTNDLNFLESPLKRLESSLT